MDSVEMPNKSQLAKTNLRTLHMAVYPSFYKLDI